MFYGLYGNRKTVSFLFQENIWKDKLLNHD